MPLVTVVLPGTPGDPMSWDIQPFGKMVPCASDRDGTSKPRVATLARNTTPSRRSRLTAAPVGGGTRSERQGALGTSSTVIRLYGSIMGVLTVCFRSSTSNLCFTIVCEEEWERDRTSIHRAVNEALFL